MSKNIDKRAAIALVIWLGASLIAVLPDAFGMQPHLGLGASIAYAFGVIGALIGSFLYFSQRVKPENAPDALLIWGSYVIVVSALFSLLQTWLAPEFRDMRFVGAVFLAVGVMAACVAFTHRRMQSLGINLDEEAALPTAPSQSDLVKMLPECVRAPLVRLEAQDHYVMVVTEEGQATVLLRLSDAIKLTTGEDGHRVHRSNWVANTAVARAERKDKRDFLILNDGSNIPVSRTYKDNLQGAGLI